MSSRGSELGLGIGALSRATGIPINTLRTWERRYGVPAPERTEGGQRVYDQADVQRLQLIARALENGHRPGQIMRATVGELGTLVGESTPMPVTMQGGEGVDPLMDAVQRLDGGALESQFRLDLADLGLIRFLEERIGPLLNTIGCAWEGGVIQPFQEHFASEHIRDFLALYWRKRSEVARGPVGVCAALPGERHHLGLHLVACVLAANDWRVLFLGGDTPLADVESCVQQVQVKAVFFSVALGAPRSDTRWVLTALRARLPAEVDLVVGGMGAPADIAGLQYIASLQDLDRRLAEAGRN